MTVQGVLAVIILVVAAVFAIMNQGLLYETQTIRVPGGTYTLPLVGILVAVTAGAVLLMLLADTFSSGLWRGANRRLHQRLADRDRELAAMKSGSYDDVSAKLAAMREELSDRIAALARLIETRPAHTVVREMREEPAGITPPR
jgi:uncharacterized integral membrane protein